MNTKQRKHHCLTSRYERDVHKLIMTSFKLKILFFSLGIYIALTNFPAYSREKNLEDLVPEELIERSDSFLTVTTENDLYGSGKDKDYTNGFRLTYSEADGPLPGFTNILEKAFPWFHANETTRAYYSIGQNIYTPENIVAEIPDPKDRPYAAFLYGSVGFNTLHDNHVDEVEVTLGIVGPSAIGEPIQTSVHELIGSDKPLGWDSQLKDEPGLIISFQRLWPEIYATDFHSLHFRVAPHIGVSLGNVYTYAASGVTFQITPQKHIWQATPLRVRPAIPGSGYFAGTKNQFAWSLFSAIETRAMVHNIFLDGNTFRRSASVNKKYIVLDAIAGVTLTYDSTQLAYTMNWRSKEFNGQDSSSFFGALSLAYRF